MRFAYYAHKSTVPALIVAGGALYILDQLSKWMAIRSIPAGESIAVIPNFFSLVQVHNTGAAFGILPGNNVVFVILSILALVSLVGIAKLGLLRSGTLVVAATLAAVGILGNLTSRLLHGHVTDLLLFNLHVPMARPWPAFNLADVCIFTAAILFIAISLSKERNTTRQISD